MAISEKDFALELQSFINLQQTKINHASDIKQVVQGLQDVMGRFSIGAVAPEATYQISNKSKYFARFLEFLLQPLCLDWYEKLSKEEKVQYFDVFFDEGPVEETFIVLSGSLTRLNRPQHIHHVASLMASFAERNRFMELFLKQTESTPAIQRSAEKVSYECLITCVVSIPDRLANHLKRNNYFKQFHPEKYFHLIASQIVLSLEKLHDSLSTVKNCSFQFISDLIGRASFLGQGGHIFSILLPFIEKWIDMTPLWKRICNHVITGIPDNGLDNAMEHLLKGIEEPLIIGKLLGDKILSHSRLKYLLTTKFILLRYYSQISVPYNIVTYLAGCKRRHLLVETLMTVLDVWGEQTAVKHTPYDQHVYITRVIILCFAHLSSEERQVHKQKLLTKLLAGMQSHLDSPIEKVRHLGMAAAECVTSGLDPDSSTPLKFEYQRTEEIELLFALAQKPSTNHLKQFKERFKVLCGGNASTNLKLRNQIQCKRSDVATASDITTTDTVKDDDDDDGLKPYDLTDDDVNTTNGKSPKYIRDCIEGLLETDNPEKTEASLNALEKVICAQPDDLEELAVELVKILVHTGDKYSTENFATIRHSAMVAITTRCPRQVAEYLTQEIFAANYNLQQRIDMLDVLASSAEELAEPVELLKKRALPKKFQVSKPMLNEVTQESSVADWKAIVQERIESKTRRFSKPQKPATPAVANKFADVAGYFFYPLLRNFDIKLNTLDLLGKDSFVLAKLIQTLSTIMYCARATVSARAMGITFIEFLWALRYHNEPYVRQAIIFAVAMVIVSVPSSLLIADASREMFEMHDWLKDLAQQDPSTECRHAALQTLLLFEGVFASRLSETS